MIVSELTTYDYDNSTAYFNKLCEMIVESTAFTEIYKGSNIYKSQNFGLKAVYKLNTTIGDRYLHIQTNENGNMPFYIDNYLHFNPAKYNVNYLNCYVSPYYFPDKNPIGNYDKNGINGTVSYYDVSFFSVFENSGNSKAFFLKNEGSIHAISFFKQQYYSQFILKFNTETGFLACSATSSGSSYQSGWPFFDRAPKGLLFNDCSYFYSVNKNKMTTMIDDLEVFTFNKSHDDIHKNSVFGLFFNNKTISKLTNKTTNLAVTAPIILNNMRNYFDDIHYISMKNLKPQEIFNIGEQEYIAFPLDSMTDIKNFGYVLGYCFRVK